MAHSTIAFKGCVYLVRDDVLYLIIEHVEKYAEQMNFDWLSHASKEWLDHCDLMPPGAKRIDLDGWVSDDVMRRQFISAIEFLSREVRDQNLLQLMHLADLVACIEGKEQDSHNSLS